MLVAAIHSVARKMLGGSRNSAVLITVQDTDQQRHRNVWIIRDAAVSHDVIERILHQVGHRREQPIKPDRTRFNGRGQCLNFLPTAPFLLCCGID